MIKEWVSNSLHCMVYRLEEGAHMAVIDGIMSLYIKEVLIPEKIVEVVKKFSYVDINSEMPSNAEEAAVLWINKCCKALEQED
ncbi:hypothetical protein TNCV_2377961 [Trichonephila clavipes]|nr:hypothetical protein TNCV_2377961 [Trichonephila clavipes]